MPRSKRPKNTIRIVASLFVKEKLKGNIMHIYELKSIGFEEHTFTNMRIAQSYLKNLKTTCEKNNRVAKIQITHE